MDNVRPEETEYQFVTSPSGEALVRNVHVRRSERIRNYPHRYNPVFRAAREWNNDAIASIVYIIQDRDLNSNVDTDDIQSLLDEWYEEDLMYTPKKFHMRESYVLNTQSHDHHTPTYMEALSGESSEEYFKAMYYEIKSLMIRGTWDIVSRKSVADHDVLPGTLSLKFKRKPDCTIRKFKVRYCVRGDIQKIMPPKPLKLYYPVVQWATVKLMLILQCIIGLQSQSIEFTNAFAQADIPSGEPVFIELPRDFKSDGEQGDVVLRLKKSLYGQAKVACLWYEKLRFCFRARSRDDQGGSLTVHV